VITTIMLNWIAYWVGSYAFGRGGPLQNKVDISVPVSSDIAPSARLPTFWGNPQLQALHIGLFIALGALVALWTTADALRVNPADLLRGTGGTQIGGMRHANALRRVLLVVQAAIFVVLITGASAFVLSLRRATAVDVGFDVKSLMAASIPLPADDRVHARALMERAYQRVAALPGVESASLGYMEPWRNNTDVPFTIPGSTVTPPYTMFDMVTPEYLRTIGASMKAGRWIAPTDIAGSPFVVVVNETFERTFWQAGEAIGQCVRVGADSITES
jgi:hypothetical protein